MRKFLKILLTLLVLLIGLLLVAAVLGFVFRDKLVAWGQTKLDQSLASQGVFMDYELARVESEGDLHLRLSDVTLFKTSARENPAAHLTAVDLTMPIGDSIKAGFPLLDALAEQQTLTVYGDGGDNPQFSDLNLHLEVRPGELHLPQLTTSFQGLELEATGDFQLPPAAKKDKPAVEVVEVPETEPAETGPTPSAIDLSPVLDAAKALDYRDAGFTPKVVAKIQTTIPDPGVTGVEIAAQTTSFPSQNINLALDGQLAAQADGSLDIGSVILREGQSQAEVTGKFDLLTESITVAPLKSNLDWVGILRDLPALAGGLDTIRVDSAPVIQIDGTHLLADPNSSSVTATLRQLSAAVQVQEEGAPLEISDLTLDANLDKGDLKIANATAGLAQGTAELTGQLRPFDEELTWQGNLTANNLSLEALSALGGEQTYPGLVALSFDGNGALGVESLNGDGRIEITESKFVDIPILGGLVGTLSQIVPSPVANSFQDKMSAHFVIKDGTLTTDNLNVAASAAEVDASGMVDLVRSETQFKAAANLRGALGTLTSAMSEALKIEGAGPFHSVDWQFKNLSPGESIQKKIAGAISMDGEKVEEKVEENVKQDAKNDAEDAASEELLQAGQKAVKKLNKFLKGFNLGESTAQSDPKPGKTPPKPGAAPQSPEGPKPPPVAPPKSGRPVPQTP